VELFPVKKTILVACQGQFSLRMRKIGRSSAYRINFDVINEIHDPDFPKMG
jgi:hypothetical protein